VSAFEVISGAPAQELKKLADGMEVANAAILAELIFFMNSLLVDISLLSIPVFFTI
jgi:hypothetical protein